MISQELVDGVAQNMLEGNWVLLAIFFDIVVQVVYDFIATMFSSNRRNQQ